MKRILLFLALLASLVTASEAFSKGISRSKLSYTISDCRHCEGAETVHLGGFLTGLAKGVAGVVSIGDRDVREALKLCRGVRGITIFNYEDCSAIDRIWISRKIERALDGSEVLMEVKGGGEELSMYGIVDDRGGKVKDFVLYSPEDCSVICLFGTISVDIVAKFAAND